MREWNGVNNLMDLERALHKKCNRIPMVVGHANYLFVCSSGFRR